MNGFHSQAGWIAFSMIAVGFCCTIQQVPWFTTREHNRKWAATLTGNPTAAFLLPFLTILAAGMIAGAASDGFEWLYPLRFFAAAGTLWVCDGLTVG